MKLDNRVALVTGAGSGIGRAIAKLFAEEGASVVVNDVRLDHAEETVSLIKAIGGEAMAIVADVSDYNQVENMVETTISKYEKLDILVSNAGIAHSSLLYEMTPEEWDVMIKVNLYGTFNCCRCAINPMLERKYGRVIIVSSLTALRGDPTQTHYGAAKGGQVVFAKALSKEVVSKGITVNALAPGLTETAILNQPDPDLLKANMPPVGRVGKPIDQAYAALYLASDEAEFVTGQVLSANGGLG